jgi:hypothetical protein
LTGARELADLLGHPLADAVERVSLRIVGDRLEVGRRVPDGARRLRVRVHAEPITTRDLEQRSRSRPAPRRVRSLNLMPGSYGRLSGVRRGLARTDEPSLRSDSRLPVLLDDRPLDLGHDRLALRASGTSDSAASHRRARSAPIGLQQFSQHPHVVVGQRPRSVVPLRIG